MQEYQKHIKGLDGRSICGEYLTGMEWVYTDIEHALLSAPKDRLQPCPDCAKKIIDVFQDCV